MSILEFLGFNHKKQDSDGAGADPDTVRKIAATLDRMDPDRARYIASFAFLLCRAVRANLKITDNEVREMERILVERGKLAKEQAILVAQMAKTQSMLFGGTEDFLVTREFNRIATREQKLSLLDCMFSVSAVDTITTAEENEISQVCSELNLNHDDYIATLSTYRQYRAVLKSPPKKNG
jgi:uncharacterized tellurite resistance protein B-like protein